MATSRVGHDSEVNLHQRKRAAGIYAQAENYRRNGQGDKALDGYNQAISLMPEHIGYRLARARYFFSRGDDIAAFTDIDFILTRQPENLDILSLKAQVLSAGGNQERAVECYTQMLEIDPDSASIYYNRGYLNYVLGRYDDSLGDLDQACLRHPGLFEAYYYRGMILIKQGQPEAAWDDLRKARSLRPNSRQVKDALQQLQTEYNLDTHNHRKRTSNRTPKLLQINKKLNWFN